MTATVADILIEALPYIRRFYGRTIVIKYGGHAMVDPGLKKDFARDITLLKFIGLNPVVVHGGGPQIGSVLEQMGIRSHFVDGMRVTDEPTMDVVEMVLVGNVNKAIVSRICQFGGNAVGLSGKDGGLLLAEKMQLVRSASAADEPPEIIDMGMVGDVVGVNPEIIRTLETGGFIPVIAPVGVGKSGETYNINADWVACKIALSFHAIKFMLLTDVEGLLDNAGELISTTTVPETERLLADGSISGGMIPKMRCALEAAKGGVDSVHIIDGRKPHAVLLELFTDRGIGTQVTDDG